MKLNKGKNKGKVHPSPSSPSSSSTTTQNDPVTSLNHLLPTAILTLISILSLQDKEVLSYLITHSLSSSSSSSSSSPTNTKAKKQATKKGAPQTVHKVPSFECGCFECYSMYWHRWNSSPHKDLIHLAIDSFEDHLASSEQTNTAPKNKSRKNSKVAKLQPLPAEKQQVAEVEKEEVVGSPEAAESGAQEEEKGGGVHQEEGERRGGAQEHKGLARKVLPDVIGLFHNSRLWNLWGPNV